MNTFFLFMVMNSGRIVHMNTVRTHLDGCAREFQNEVALWECC